MCRNHHLNFLVCILRTLLSIKDENLLQLISDSQDVCGFGMSSTEARDAWVSSGA